MMHVSHETIYQSLFVQGRGEFRRERARCLRSGRTARRPRSRVERRGRIADMVMLSDPPQEADDRGVPGHWEGDLILDAGGRSAVGALVERSTRLVLLLHLPEGRAACNVEAAMTKAITALPGELARSITWDQGAEMTHHSRFTVATGVPIYFATPIPLGSADPTKTPTVCCASICPRAPTCRSRAPWTSSEFNAASMVGLARPWDT
jgi:transposase, IS30 family